MKETPWTKLERIERQATATGDDGPAVFVLQVVGEDQQPLADRELTETDMERVRAWAKAEGKHFVLLSWPPEPGDVEKYGLYPVAANREPGGGTDE